MRRNAISGGSFRGSVLLLRRNASFSLGFILNLGRSRVLCKYLLFISKMTHAHGGSLLAALLLELKKYCTLSPQAWFSSSMVLWRIT